MNDFDRARLVEVLKILEVPTSTWYRKEQEAKTKTPKKDRRKKPIPVEIRAWVKATAVEYPWGGYKRIAVICRRSGAQVSNRQAYRVMRDEGLLQKKTVCRKAELYQTSKLWELLPCSPNELWQMDVTYIHIPGFGWWYAITVIDYYSRYLLSARLSSSYSALEATLSLGEAQREAERLCGSLATNPFLVTDNGSSFIAKRFRKFVEEDFSHVRIQYRTPTQLGLLERFHKTLKDEEVYWRIYDNPAHCRECLEEFKERYNNVRPHWALIPESGGDPMTPREVYVDGLVTQIPKWQGWAKGAKEKLDQMMNEAC